MLLAGRELDLELPTLRVNERVELRGEPTSASLIALFGRRAIADRQAEQLVRQKWPLLKATLDERGWRLGDGEEADAIRYGVLLRLNVPREVSVAPTLA